MILVAIIIKYLFGFLAAVSAVLLGVTFTKTQRNHYPILRKLDGKQIYLFVIFCVSLIICYGANAWEDYLPTQFSLEEFHVLYIRIPAS